MHQLAMSFVTLRFRM